MFGVQRSNIKENISMKINYIILKANKYFYENELQDCLGYNV